LRSILVKAGAGVVAGIGRNLLRQCPAAAHQRKPSRRNSDQGLLASQSQAMNCASVLLCR
jgi:hypothetical protein